MLKGEKAQVTIFVIIALVLVGGVILFLAIRTQISPSSSGGSEANINSFLDSCLENSVREAIDLTISHGGTIEPKLYLRFKFDGEESKNISYLCYTEKKAEKCVNQEPMLFNHINKEIYDYVKDDVQNCFDELVINFDKQGFVADANKRGFEIVINPKDVELKIDAEIFLTKNEETIKQENFVLKTPSKLYDLTLVSQEIVSKKAENCNFDYIGFLYFYPQYKIKKIQTFDGSEIYSINYRGETERFDLALRGCVIPPGY